MWRWHGASRAGAVRAPLGLPYPPIPPTPPLTSPARTPPRRAFSGHAGEGPWLTVGVLVRKDCAATAGGQGYSRWLLSDLRGGELRAVLFGDAHGERRQTVRRRGRLASARGGMRGVRRARATCLSAVHTPGRARSCP